MLKTTVKISCSNEIRFHMSSENISGKSIENPRIDYLPMHSVGKEEPNYKTVK